MKKKYKVYGPVQDGMFSKYQVIGPHGCVKSEHIYRKDAEAVVKYLNSTKLKIIL